MFFWRWTKMDQLSLGKLYYFCKNFKKNTAHLCVLSKLFFKFAVVAYPWWHLHVWGIVFLCPSVKSGTFELSKLGRTKNVPSWRIYGCCALPGVQCVHFYTHDVSRIFILQLTGYSRAYWQGMSIGSHFLWEFNY